MSGADGAISSLSGSLGCGSRSTACPVRVPSFIRSLPEALVLPFFVRRVPEMIVSYADAAALMLANLTPAGEMSRRRVGLALPVGMRGKKAQWAARPSAAQQSDAHASNGRSHHERTRT